MVPLERSDRYRYVLEAHRDWCEHRNVRILTSLSAKTFEAYLIELRQQENPYPTVHDIATLIKQFCKWAVVRGLSLRTPAANVPTDEAASQTSDGSDVVRHLAKS